MNAASRELFRQCLLVQLNQAAPYAVPTGLLKVAAITGGFQVSDQELGAELDYLQGKRLAAEDDKLISPENKRWKITADGRDYLAKQGLA
jgi:hypothetical protein